MVLRNNSFLFFWLPRTTYTPPPSSANCTIVPASRGFLKITFPTLASSLPSAFSQQGKVLEKQLSDVLGLQVKAYLMCRWLIGWIMLYILVVGVLIAIFNNPPGAIISMCIMLFLWAIVIKLVMNRYGDILRDYEPWAQYRLSLLSQTLTAAGINLRVGESVYWLEIAAVTNERTVELTTLQPIKG